MSMRIAAVLLTLGAAMPAAATATVLDFDAARGNNGRTGYVYGSWQEDGYRVSASRCSSNNTCFVTSGTGRPSLDRVGAALVNMTGGATTTVARMDGGAFFLDSLQMANNYGNASGFGAVTMNVDFAFSFADGTRRAATYVLDNFAGQWLTVNTLRFDQAALTAFSFTPRGGSSGFVQFDNIELRDAVAAIPEPASWALMLTGFALTGAALRRRGRLQVA